MGLFTPIWMTQDSAKKDKAQKAIKKTSDQSTLIEAAKHAPLNEVRKAAFIKIKDHDVRNEFLKHEKDENLRYYLVYNYVKEEAALFDFAMNDPSPLVREYAAERLSMEERISDNIFERLARESQDEKVRAASIGKITDQKLLEELYRTEANGSVRLAMVAALSDQEQISDIAHHDENIAVRKHAISKLTDIDILASLINSLSLEDAEALEEACRQLLFRHSLTHDSESVPELVIEKSPSFETKIKAADMMKDQEKARKLLTTAAFASKEYFEGKEEYLYGRIFHKMIKEDVETLAHTILEVFEREEMTDPFISMITTGLMMGWTQQMPSMEWLKAHAGTRQQELGIEKLMIARDEMYGKEHHKMEPWIWEGTSQDHREGAYQRLKDRFYNPLDES